jgi:hypothetical protein
MSGIIGVAEPETPNKGEIVIDINDQRQSKGKAWQSSPSVFVCTLSV